MITEIKWTYAVIRKGENYPSVNGAISSIDLSAPPRLIENVGSQYAPCHVIVYNSVGEKWEKDWE